MSTDRRPLTGQHVPGAPKLLGCLTPTQALQTATLGSLVSYSFVVCRLVRGCARIAASEDACPVARANPARRVSGPHGGALRVYRASTELRLQLNTIAKYLLRHHCCCTAKHPSALFAERTPPTGPPVG